MRGVVVKQDAGEGSGALPGGALSEEDRRLIQRFQDLEQRQLVSLDAAGQRVIELTSLLLGLLFAALAFGDDFPPPYLAGHALAQGVAVAALLCFLGAILFGLRAVQPRSFAAYRHNLSAMARELDRLMGTKSLAVRIAGWFFFGGCCALALLVGVLILRGN